jgi:hypothetical protein
MLLGLLFSAPAGEGQATTQQHDRSIWLIQSVLLEREGTCVQTSNGATPHLYS